MSPQKKKGKTRTPRPKPRPLKLKQAKLKQPDPRQRYLPSYEIELGIQPVPTLSGDVSEALCKFCIAFGREEKPQNAAGPFEALLTNEKRKQATTKKAFRSFRRDNIISHMKDQHKTKYEEFISLPNESRLRLSFFDLPTMMDSFLGGTRSCHLEIPNGIVELIRELYFNGDGVVADVVLSAGNILGVDNIRGAENALSVDTVLQDDFIAGVEADEFVEETDSKHLLVIPDRLQFETVVKCSNAMVSFRSITRVFGVFGEALKNSRLGRPTEYIVGRYIRSLVAINLTALRIILSNVWGVLFAC